MTRIIVHTEYGSSYVLEGSQYVIITQTSDGEIDLNGQYTDEFGEKAKKRIEEYQVENLLGRKTE